MGIDDITNCTLELRGELTIRTAAETHRQLLSAVQSHAALTLNMTYADDVDLTLLQLLSSTARSASQSGKRFTLATPLPEHVSAVLARGGFALSSIEAV